MRKRVLLTALLALGLSLSLTSCLVKRSDSQQSSEAQSSSLDSSFPSSEIASSLPESSSPSSETASSLPESSPLSSETSYPVQESSFLSSEVSSEPQKETIGGIRFEGASFVYDGQPHSIFISGDLPIGVSVAYEGNGKINAGQYQVTATFRDSTNRYIVPEPMAATMTIEKATVSGLVFADASFVYDGQPHSIFVSGELPDGVSVAYEGNGAVNAGEYLVIARFTSDSNHVAIPDMSATITIEKAAVDMSGVSFLDASFTYDGQGHSIFVSGELPDGVSVAYEGNGAVNAGEYQVTAHFATDANHNAIPDMSATLTIAKADTDMSGISFADASFVYDGQLHSIFVSGPLPDGVTVSYEGNEKANAGVYDVTAHFETDGNHNPIPDMSAKLTIEKADLNYIPFNDAAFVYDGQPHSALIRENLPEEVEVTYEGNGKVDAGEYTVTARFEVSSNYEPIADKTAKLTIAKAVIGNIEFNDASMVYDGDPHSIAIASELPDGVSVTYEGNGQSELGQHQVTAHFEVSSNYEPIADKTATMSIVEGDNLHYSLNTDGASYTLIRGYAPESGKLVIPSTHDGLPVTAIGTEALAYSWNLETLIIPESVSSIGQQACYNCPNLVSVSLPNSVSRIGYLAFAECPSLIYNEKDGVRYLGNGENPYVLLSKVMDTSLTSLSVPEGTRSIEMWAFQNCSELKSLSLPNSLASTNGEVFQNCFSLEYTEYENALYLGNESNPYLLLAKAKNQGISACTIHPQTKIVGYAAFQFCQSLTSLVIPDNIIQLAQHALASCSALETVQLGSGFSQIEDYAFAWCESLESISLPSTIKEIEPYAFAYCSKLTSLSIPENVVRVSESAIDDCSSLTAIEVDPANPCLSSIDGILYNKQGTELLIYPKGIAAENFEVPDKTMAIAQGAFRTCRTLKSVTIPSSVKAIETAAFFDCTGLVSCELPEGLTVLQSSIFSFCKSLVSVNIPSSVTAIGQSAFRHCQSLASITLPDELTSIAGSAFEGCSSLISVIIPSNVTFIGWHSFYDCPKLESVVIPAATQTIQEGAFSNCVSLASFIVEEGNQSFASIDGVLFNADASELLIYPAKLANDAYEIPSSVTSIAPYAFSGCLALKSIIIPSSMRQIPDYGFSGCSSLVSIEIPDTISSLGSYAFQGCSSLASIAIPTTITAIPYGCFEGCESLASVSLPDTLVSIDDHGFDGCKALGSIVLPESVTKIPYCCFMGCISLSSITILGDVTEIGVFAFYGTGLTSIALPNSVAIIQEGAFRRCASLSSIVLPESLTYIDGWIFYECSGLTSIVIPTSITRIEEQALSECSSLAKIFYRGSIEQWNAIEIDSMNYSVSAATIYCYSETEPSEAGNYWHYVEGVPTIW